VRSNAIVTSTTVTLGVNSLRSNVTMRPLGRIGTVCAVGLGRALLGWTRKGEPLGWELSPAISFTTIRPMRTVERRSRRLWYDYLWRGGERSLPAKENAPLLRWTLGVSPHLAHTKGSTFEGGLSTSSKRVGVGQSGPMAVYYTMVHADRRPHPSQR